MIFTPPPLLYKGGLGPFILLYISPQPFYKTVGLGNLETFLYISSKIGQHKPKPSLFLENFAWYIIKGSVPFHLQSLFMFTFLEWGKIKPTVKWLLLGKSALGFQVEVDPQIIETEPVSLNWPVKVSLSLFGHNLLMILPDSLLWLSSN